MIVWIRDWVLVPVATVATAVLMLRASSASTNSINIPLIKSKLYWTKLSLLGYFNIYYLLVTLAGVFSKIDPGPKKEQVLDQLSDYLGWSLVQLGCCSPKHATNIGVSLIKALLCNRLHKFMFFPKHISNYNWKVPGWMAIHGKAFSHCSDCDSPQPPLSSCGYTSPTVWCSCKISLTLVATLKVPQKYLKGSSKDLIFCILKMR